MIEEFGSEHLELLKQRGACPYEYKTVLKDLMKSNYLTKNVCLVQQKKEKLVMIVKN